MGNENTVTGDGKADFIMRQEALARAGVDPLPGPLTGAFAKGAIKVGDLNVRKIVASDWQIFKATDSPLLQVVQEMQQSPEVKPEVEFAESARDAVCWQFTNKPVRVREVVQAGTLTATVQEEWSDGQTAETSNLVFIAVMEQMKRAWQTALKFSAELQESGEITFFQDASQAKETASAGGSTTAAS